MNINTGLDTRENSCDSRGDVNDSDVDIDTFEASLFDFLENFKPVSIYNSRCDT